MKKTHLTDIEIANINRDCYDALGESYSDGVGDLETIIKLGAWQEFINRTPGKKFLNVGCGTGDASAWLDQHAFEVTSTDISPVMVNLTEKKCPASRNLVLPATELDKLRGEKFDGILAIHLIQHLSKTMLGGGVFKQIHDLLSENGVFLLAFTNTCYLKTGYQEEGSMDGVYTFWHKYGLEDIVPLLNKARLKPFFYHPQKSPANSCGNVEPFIFICKKK